jgi:hypothetical protein
MIRTRRWTRSFALLALPLVLACGRGDGEPEQEEPPTVVGGPVTEVRVTMAEGTAVLWQSEVLSGQVRFVLMNQGQRPHRLRLASDQHDWASDAIEAGQTLSWTVGLPPGSYLITAEVTDGGDLPQPGTSDRLTVR